MSKSSGSFKKQTIFNSYDEFLKYTDLSDRVLMFMFYDFNIDDPILSDLILKLKSSNTRIYNFKISKCSQTMKNIFDIVEFMDEHQIDTVIAIGEDFLGEILKAINVFYNNINITSLVELEENKGNLKFEKIRETIFISTTGGGNEVHRYFKVIDDKLAQVTIFDNSMAKIDKVILDSKISKLSPIEYIMYYLFSTIANVVDIILNDSVDDSTREVCKDILVELMTILENGDRFGDSLLFRERVLSYSREVSKIIDNVGYGILYLYGSLIESVFSIPRNTIDALGIEFILNEVMMQDGVSIDFKKYFNVSGFDYVEFIKNVKVKYGAKAKLSFYKLDEERFNNLKVVAMNFLIKHKIIEKYSSIGFREDFNNRLFEYYLNGVN